MPTPLPPEHRALLCLVRSGLWEHPADDLAPFPLSEAQWRKVFRMALRQTVVGIAFRGLHHLPDSLSPGGALLLRWVAEADRVERQNRTMNAILGRLLEQMAAHGFHPIVLKGQAVAAFYPHPLLRECGDIDLWFPSKAAACEAARLVCPAGCSPPRWQPDGSILYSWQGVAVEHHTRLFDLHSPFLRGYLAALVRNHGFSVRQLPGSPPGAPDFPSSVLPAPSPLPSLLLLNAHLLKHLLSHGVGLRQFCDMAMAYHALRGTYSSVELADAYRRCGLQRWSACLHAFLVEYLGLDAVSLPPTGLDATLLPRLSQIVFDGGNFGQYGSTKGRPAQPVWQRKWHTALSFRQRHGFANACARGEAFWTALALAVGNLRQLVQRAP